MSLTFEFSNGGGSQCTEEAFAPYATFLIQYPALPSVLMFNFGASRLKWRLYFGEEANMQQQLGDHFLTLLNENNILA